MSRWQRFAKGLPLGLALLTVAAVWLAGAVWSFEEQTRLADRLAFAVPWLLPLVLDGLAVSLAGVAYAAALDGRAAVQARLMTAVAVAASAGSNAAAAGVRSGPAPADLLTVVIAGGVPVGANLAFEVLLGELRRQVYRRRGLPAPVAIPFPRLARVVLAPIVTVREYRSTVLLLTAPALPRAVGAGPRPPAAIEAGPEVDLDGPDHEDHGPDGVDLEPEADLDVPAEVLDLARTIATDLAADGKTMSKRALIDGFRARGKAVSSDRAAVMARYFKASA